MSPSTIAGPGVVAPVNTKLSEALDHAFAETEQGPPRFTKAVVVAHHGRVVGERYAPGITPATPVLGYSMTKSVTNALFGVLVGKGKVDMYEPAPIAEWSATGDPRRSITAIHLWASTRDWARFGLLYLRDGVAESGKRILPEGWVDDAAQLTPQSAAEYGYGAGFWTQRGNSAAARARIAAGFSADSFAAIGSQGQYTIVIPSHDLAIVKIGWAYTPHDDHVAVERLVRETIAGLQSTQARRLCRRRSRAGSRLSKRNERSDRGSRP